MIGIQSGNITDHSAAKVHPLQINERCKRAFNSQKCSRKEEQLRDSPLILSLMVWRSIYF